MVFEKLVSLSQEVVSSHTHLSLLKSWGSSLQGIARGGLRLLTLSRTHLYIRANCMIMGSVLNVCTGDLSLKCGSKTLQVEQIELLFNLLNRTLI